MGIVKFESKWIEKCVRKVLNKPDGGLDSGEIFKIKYAKAGGDFGGSIVLELSTELPPEPFAAFDGGDEWIICLHSETTLGEKYKLEDYIRVDREFWLNYYKTERWKYALSQEAEKKWKKFERSIIKSDISEDYTEEELNAADKDFLPMEDLSLFSGLTVLRLYEAEVASTAWFRAFPELKVLELAEVGVKTKKNSAEEFSGLKQLTFWSD